MITLSDCQPGNVVELAQPLSRHYTHGIIAEVVGEIVGCYLYDPQTGLIALDHYSGIPVTADYSRDELTLLHRASDCHYQRSEARP